MKRACKIAYDIIIYNRDCLFHKDCEIIPVTRSVHWAVNFVVLDRSTRVCSLGDADVLIDSRLST